ncbi:MAG: phosphatidate cytidylyltransferase [Actinomycetia bacterium]|nr:phosphatidate cytidylyltransferase [Actinomycetes bacterium]
MTDSTGAPLSTTNPSGMTGERRRAGRNVPVATAVGATMAALVLVSLYTVTVLFVALVVVAVVIAVYEVCEVLAKRSIDVPVFPLVVGGAAMVVAAYADGTDALTVALILTIVAMAVARVAGAGGERLAKDVVVGAFVAVYVPLLAASAVLMVAADDGADRIVVFILAVALSDTGGFAAGVRFGKHPMAPSVSPKKSWEGLAGSVVAATLGSAVAVPLLLGATWWQGALVGLVAVVTATVGDLAESLLKRDLGVKDMGRLLPEHGGMMDRLDSLLPTAPVMALVLAAVAG